jgi:electron transfer flavoprotein alpha subunit
METILVLAHTESDGSLAKPALEAVQAAQTLLATLGPAKLLVGLVGENVQTGASQIAGAGASRILGVTGPDFGQPRYASDAAAAEAICRAAQASLVIAAGTARANRVLPGVSQRLQGGVDTHVTGLTAQNGVVEISRWYYRQRIEATLRRQQRPWIMLVDPGCFPAWTGAPGTAAVELITVNLPEQARRTQITGIQAPPTDAQTIRPEAKLLFVAGAGWTKKQSDGQSHLDQAERLILEFLARTRASLGSSKSLVDLSGEGQAVLSFLTHLNQIGQTGATPRHLKGLATCCHGEEPHTVGWRFITERRAVNLDPNCGWARGKADVLYIGDAFAVMEKVNALLAQGLSFGATKGWF